jgi:hypothetical protein
MTTEVFGAQLERLRKTWGPDKYPQERIAVMWAALRELPGDWFVACCTDFIGNMLKPPVLKDFLADAEDWRRREKQYQATRERGGGGSPDAPVARLCPDQLREILATVDQKVRDGAIAERQWIQEQKTKSRKAAISGRDRAAGKDE